MAYKLTTLTLIFLSIMALAFSRAFGQQNAPFRFSNCPAPAICCVVPNPQMTQPVPGSSIPQLAQQGSVNLYGAHVSNINTPLATPTPTPPPIVGAATPTPTPTPTGSGTPTATPTGSPTATMTPTPTVVPTPIPGADGGRWLQFFDATTMPPRNSAPIGSSSWFVAAQRDRDMDVGAGGGGSGWAFNHGIMACCSTSQATFQPGDGCGFLLEYY